MAKARQIVKRRKAVANVRKITQTMQLIATARFQKCLQRATASKPYTKGITEMIETLAGMESADHFLLKPNEGVKKSILLVISANRGFCGAYNSNLLKAALVRQKELVAAGNEVDIEAVGKKALAFLRFLKITPTHKITSIEDRVPFALIAELAERYMAAYQKREIAHVDVVYTRFVSAGQQIATLARLLPIEPPKATGAAAAASSKNRPQFEFSPPPAELLQRLIPESVKVRLYQFFNESIVSEQIARMSAMKAATDAARDMIKSLSSQYNRARQSQITSELADIVGGAEAVK
ncbi:MAG: ATP synthase F1 subunit gamma [Phycisphaerae bacterium]|nr:ATP synthase F1 subunit gamma [Phycisphaerae bacterium]